MIMMSFASKSLMIATFSTSNELQARKPLAYDVLACNSYNFTHIACHSILWVQGTRRYLCTVHGDWSFFWENGRDFRAVAARVVP